MLLSSFEWTHCLRLHGIRVLVLCSLCLNDFLTVMFSCADERRGRNRSCTTSSRLDAHRKFTLVAACYSSRYRQVDQPRSQNLQRFSVTVGGTVRRISHGHKTCRESVLQWSILSGGSATVTELADNQCYSGRYCQVDQPRLQNLQRFSVTVCGTVRWISHGHKTCRESVLQWSVLSGGSATVTELAENQCYSGRYCQVEQPRLQNLQRISATVVGTVRWISHGHKTCRESVLQWAVLSGGSAAVTKLAVNQCYSGRYCQVDQPRLQNLQRISATVVGTARWISHGYRTFRESVLQWAVLSGGSATVTELAVNQCYSGRYCQVDQPRSQNVQRISATMVGTVRWISRGHKTCRESVLQWSVLSGGSATVTKLAENQCCSGRYRQVDQPRSQNLQRISK